LHPEGGHRWLLVVNAVMVGLVCVAGVVALTGMTGMRWWIGVRDALVLGAVASVGTVGLTLAMASLVGSMTTRLAMFPLMHVACQGACALSALLIAWTAGNWLLLAVLTLLEDVARAWIGFEWIGAAVVAANVAVLAVYIVLLWRMVMAARFANW
ncbi:MAG: hypothetical protein ACODAQ_10015, partial [Phycisphaeraceae bacterium]